MSNEVYSEEFFSKRKEGLFDAVAIVAGVILEKYKPGSVLDVGCGTGAWLAHFQREGCRIQGIDGEWVPDDQLDVDAGSILRTDLTRLEPAAVAGQFDVAICLEVVEHLPREAAEAVIRFLTAKAPVVVFSGAIPGQGGTGHITECWQSSWAAVFRDCGFRANDCIRPEIWDEAAVPFWYRQNIVVYEKADVKESAPAADFRMLDLVHPELYLRKKRKAERERGLKRLAKKLGLR
jgi:SAM-dependent methyltransferase